VELFVWELVQTLSGILLSQKLKKRSSPILNLWRMSVNRHSVDSLYVAGDDRVRAAVYSYYAETATAEGFHPHVVTERRNLDFQRAQGLENREALAKLVRLTVDR
jgi:hypothetical protein